MNYMDDKFAARLLKKKDISGLEFLVKKYQLPAVRAAYFIVRNRESAEDLVQQSFLKVFDHIEQYDETRPFAPWFFRIVINDAVKSIKREKEVMPFDHLMDRFIEINIDNPVSQILDPEESIEREEIQEMVWKAIGELSPAQRAAFVYRHYYRFSIPELAEEFDSPISTIKWRLHAARKRLRELLYGKGVNG
jgi:RNA polymerase sigma-70 factor (ECF subfamily)